MIEPSIELDHRVHDRLRVDRRRRSDRRATPNSQCASITSRPLFISVAESIVILRPIRHVGCCSASAAVTPVSSDAVRPRNGPPDAVRMSRRISDGVAAVQALVNRVVLAVDRQDRHAVPRAPPRSRCRRPSPALPCWRARSSCRARWPRAPPRAPRCRTTRTARCRRRDARRPRRARRGRCRPASTPPATRSAAGDRSPRPIAIATTRGR